MKNNNPFMPDRPVDPEYFVGRDDALKKLRSVFEDVSNGGLKFIYVRGDKGIGKTSLANYFRNYIRKELNILGFHLFLSNFSPATENDSIGSHIVEKIIKSQKDKRNLLQKVIDFSEKIDSVSFAGVRIDYNNIIKEGVKDPEDLLRFFSNLATEFSKKNESTGLLIILDEIDHLDEPELFSKFVKSLSDEAAVNPEILDVNVGIIVCGTKKIYERLHEYNFRVGDIFEIIDLMDLSNEEVIAFFKRTFNFLKIHPPEKELSLFADFCQGHPQLMHLVGCEVFRLIDFENRPSKISHNDAIIGISFASEKWADKHLEKVDSKTFKSGKFRFFSKVLREIGTDLSFKEDVLIKSAKRHFNKEEYSEKDIEDCILFLKEKELIELSNGSRREWFFKDRLLSLYIQNIGQMHSY